ncbi:MAG: hypothetical protein WDM92_09435 [Caulobacteraceae bacterium]
MRRPRLWLDIITRNRGTISYSPTFGYELCARRAENQAMEGLDLSSWRAAGIGGDMIRPGVLALFAERFAASGSLDARAYVASYGMAESTLALSFAPVDQGVRSQTLDVDRLERDGGGGRRHGPRPAHPRLRPSAAPRCAATSCSVRGEDCEVLPPGARRAHLRPRPQPDEGLLRPAGGDRAGCCRPTAGSTPATSATSSTARS